MKQRVASTPPVPNKSQGPNKSPGRGRPARPPDVRNEGQRLLIELGGTIDDIVSAVGCSRSTAHGWRSGELDPSPAMRAKLYGAFGIDAGAWGQVPGGAPSAPAARPARVPATPPSTLADCLSLLASIRAARDSGTLTGAELLRIADTAGRLLALRNRLEREQELLEARLVREHPGWHRLRDGLSKINAACPRCSKLVAELMTRLDM